VTVIGTGVLKVFKLSEQALKPLPLNANRRDTLSFTCHSWVAAADAGSGGESGKAAGGGGSDRERQLLGTVDGEILLFEVRLCGAGCRVPQHAQHRACCVCVLHTPHDARLRRRSRVHVQGTEPKGMFSVDEGRSVEALAAHSKGFAAGLDGGLVALFDRNEREGYRRTRTFRVVDHALPVRCARVGVACPHAHAYVSRAHRHPRAHTRMSSWLCATAPPHTHTHLKEPGHLCERGAAGAQPGGRPRLHARAEQPGADEGGRHEL
jgi:hypothetical protein